MTTDLVLDAAARTTAGVLLVALVAVEYGGTFLLRVTRGQHPASPLQQSFSGGSCSCGWERRAWPPAS